MTTSRNTNAWREVRGGVRPSLVLMIGAVVLLAGPTLARALPDTMIPWYVWIGGLVVTGLALVGCLPRPWASFMVSLTGLLFLAQAVSLAVALAGIAEAARAYQMLAMPKLASLGALAYTERHQHGRPRLIWLATAGAVGLARIGARTALGEFPYQAFLDLAAAALVSVALWFFARGLHRREDQWARRRLAEVSASFEDFNRP